VLWKGGDGSDEQVKVCDAELCIKHVLLLRFENVYLVVYNKESVLEIPQILCNFCCVRHRAAI
jgi:hypothetical protein